MLIDHKKMFSSLNKKEKKCNNPPKATRKCKGGRNTKTWKVVDQE
jgi:hypothetical protein